MKLAVLMATYNGGPYIREQVESILEQNLPDNCKLDLFVRDDGSTDETLEILDEYYQAGKIHLEKGNNLGAARGFMKLLQDNVGFDYYAFADQDDYWYPDKIKKGISSIENVVSPALYCTNCELVNDKMLPIGRLTHRKTPSYSLTSVLCLASCAQGCTSVFNQSLASVIQNNPLPNEFIMHDSLMTCVCALIGGTIIFDEKPSMKYRMHSSNVSGMVSAKQNIMVAVKDRIKEITTKRKISMSEQTSNIICTYGSLIDKEHMKIGKIVIAAESSIIARLKLVFSKDLRHDTLNKTIAKKLSILLGND